MMVQRRRPDLVEKMVVLDVVWTANRGLPASQLQLFVAMGLAYQWWAMYAWVLAAALPVIGKPLGDMMCVLQLNNMGRLPPSSLGDRTSSLTGLMCYPYFYFQLDGLLSCLGLRPAFDTRHNTTQVPMWWDRGGVPILFIYGGDKGFKFHSEKFETKLKMRVDCKVVKLQKGDVGCAYNVGHWVQVTAPGRVNQEIADWL
jgi:pimeloyl-ACP methyl ester carboxylesterase